MFTVIRRIFRSGWHGFWRDGEIAIATIFILFLSAILMSSLFLFKDVGKIVISEIQEKIDISVYFKEDILERDIFNIKEVISMPEEEIKTTSEKAQKPNLRRVRRFYRLRTLHHPRSVGYERLMGAKI